MRFSLLITLFLIGAVAGELVRTQSSDPLSIVWKKSTPLTEPRSGYASGVIDGKLVIAGGTYWEGKPEHWIKKIYSSRTHAFDPASQTWKQLPEAPVTLGYAASTVANDRLFLFGGYTGQGINHDIFVLEKKQNRYRWARYGWFDPDRVFALALAARKSIYILGGTTCFEAYDPAGTCCTTKTATNTLMSIEVDHPERGWHERSPYPGAKRWLPATVTDGKSIWMLGGFYQESAKDPPTTFADVLRYDIERDQWESMAPLPTAAKDAQPVSALWVENRILLFTFARKVWQLDPATSTYSEVAPLPEKVSVDRFVLIGDKIIGASGESDPEGPRRRSEWTFVGTVK